MSATQQIIQSHPINSCLINKTNTTPPKNTPTKMRSVALILAFVAAATAVPYGPVGHGLGYFGYGGLGRGGYFGGPGYLGGLGYRGGLGYYGGYLGGLGRLGLGYGYGLYDDGRYYGSRAADLANLAGAQVFQAAGNARVGAEQAVARAAGNAQWLSHHGANAANNVANRLTSPLWNADAINRGYGYGFGHGFGIGHGYGWSG